MTNQQAALLKKQWQEVTYYVVSQKGPNGFVIGPGFKAFGLANAWLRFCKMWVSTAEHTFVARQPIKTRSPYLQA